MKKNNIPEVHFYPPGDDIKWLVRKFETIRYGSGSHGLKDQFMPRPDIALVFNFKSIPQILMHDDLKLKPFFIATIPVKPLMLSIDGQIDSFIVVCKATVFSRIFKINMSNTIPIIDIHDKYLQELGRIILQQNTDEERIQCISDFINGLFATEYQPDNIDDIYNKIIENSTNMPLQEIIENVFQSKSSLQRNFLKRTGVSMKKMTRIARVHFLIESI